MGMANGKMGVGPELTNAFNCGGLRQRGPMKDPQADSKWVPMGLFSFWGLGKTSGAAIRHTLTG